MLRRRLLLVCAVSLLLVGTLPLTGSAQLAPTSSSYADAIAKAREQKLTGEGPFKHRGFMINWLIGQLENPEGKKFKGRGRVLLEDSLASARDTLENACSQDEVEQAIDKTEQPTDERRRQGR